MRKSGPRDLRLAINHAANVHGKIKPFVRIERDRIRLLNAGEQFSRRFREDGERAVTSIDVHPKLEAVRNLSNLRQGIDSAGVHGSGIRNNAEWNVARLQVGGDFCNEIVRPDFEALVDGDMAHIFSPDSQKRCCLGDGKMRLGRRVDAQAT